ncbi:MAG TPA: hypothetical protein VKD65_00015, partial [Candidatus Angelobacter sp.]|nr:hypothetical protein [Candidatus Angelobacter sp.]
CQLVPTANPLTEIQWLDWVSRAACDSGYANGVGKNLLEIGLFLKIAVASPHLRNRLKTIDIFVGDGGF